MPQCLARIHLETKIGFANIVANSAANIIGLEKCSVVLARRLRLGFPATPPLAPAPATSSPNVSAQSRQYASANADRPLPAAVAHSAPRPARACSSIPAGDNPFECTENAATRTAAPQPQALRLAPPGARIRAIDAAPLLVPRVNYQFALP